MTIRYVRDGLRIKRVEVVEAVAELTALHRQAAATAGAARDFTRRVRALKEGLLADHARRERLERRALQQERAAAPPVRRDGLLRARVRAGLSQRDLALALGMPRSSIAEAERGRRRPHPRLARWADGVLRADGSAHEGAAS